MVGVGPGTSFRSALRAEGGGVAVCVGKSWFPPVQPFFWNSISGTPCVWGVSGSGEYSQRGFGGSCEDERRRDGSTEGRLGPAEKWFAWEAISAAISPAEGGRFENDGGRAWGARAAGVVAVKASLELFRFLGVELKTEYSWAKRGVQAPGSAKRLSWGGLGVSNVGLGRTGVCRGVGGWAFGIPKLDEGPKGCVSRSGLPDRQQEQGRSKKRGQVKRVLEGAGSRDLRSAATLRADGPKKPR